MYLPFPAAYRSLSRPSSAPSAKAFALRPFSLDLFSRFEFLSLRELFFLLVLVFQLRLLVVFYPNFFVLKTLLCFVLPLLSRLIQFSRFYFEAASLFFDAGGLKWVRTIDLALIRRAL